ncbi:MAG: hypothetical protein ABI286_08980 [Edaphobacter sp.]
MGRDLRGFAWARGVALAALLMGSAAYGQVAATVQPETVVDVLHRLSDKADIIFAGQVMAIRQPNDGVVEVEFRVDEAIRGSSVGTPYILREWSGLWAGGTPRYHVGEKLLMLLHAPSAAGLSSPVGGLDGAIPIRQGGTVATAQDTVAPRQPPFVDLRWLGIKVQRTISYRTEPVRAAKTPGMAVSLSAQLQMVGEAGTGLTTSSIAGVPSVSPQNGSGGKVAGSVPAQQASVDAVIGMLTSWQKAQHVAP